MIHIHIYIHISYKYMYDLYMFAKYICTYIHYERIEIISLLFFISRKNTSDAYFSWIIA